MADGADPAGIIAFTFTERNADEIKAAFPPASKNGSAQPRSISSARRSWDDPLVQFPAAAARATAETFDVLDDGG